MRTAIALLCCLAAAVSAEQRTSVTRNGITWEFDASYECGQYVTGDWWVVGPVQIAGISNTYHTEGFTPVQGQDGSMINPPTTAKQGYDNSLGSYDSSLNVSYPNDQPISATNTLALRTDESIISAVSWLYTDQSTTETGCPGFNGATGTPRPVLRTAAILTCVSTVPAANSFRPPYCGTDKTAYFSTADINYSVLSNLDPPDVVPDMATAIGWMAKPWIDHVHEYLGGFIHPSEHMPNYGMDMAKLSGQTALMLNLDFSQLPGSPSKEPLAVGLLQFGIDVAGIIDNGGDFPPNGGHNLGRKLPVMFAGEVLGDTAMANIGYRGVMFQEDADHFYVSQAEVDMTNSAAWKPDTRGADIIPYSATDIGLPDWGVRHGTKPESDNKGWRTMYRSINVEGNTCHALTAHIMGFREQWNHEPFFDYMDRAVALGGGGWDSRPDSSKYIRYTFGSSQFTHDMWMAYRNDYGCVWVPDEIGEVDMYAQGTVDCSACVYGCLSGIRMVPVNSTALPGGAGGVYGLDGTRYPADATMSGMLPAGVYLVHEADGTVRQVLMTTIK